MEKLTIEDISFATGFIEEWLKNAPAQVKEHLRVLADGVTLYREMYGNAKDDYDSLLDRYNQLTALSANYLQMIKEQREQMNSLLADGQREFHKAEE
jgi:dsDNA-binding SOS-regulon protein